MAQGGLKYVRGDSDHLVYTQHPDHIHPRELSERLLRSYGKEHFRISLRRNIYVIYVDRKVAGGDWDDRPSDLLDGEEGNLIRPCSDYEKDLWDIKLAEKVLRKSRVTRV
ncbi:hypothetical protein BX600DRAFT_438042 [Xylariales sp. PMI_506]|nr:hypothetical protein BX600DRAFT_438042 [Xylariales sp. PMI_506]